MANKKISELESRASLSLSDLMAVGDPSTGYLYKTTISDLKTLTGAGVVSFNGRFGTVNPAEGDYTLTQLGDVIITSPSNGQVLKYNGSNWVNATEVTEADTLATVTARGNVTTGDIAVNGKITIGTAFPGTGQRIEANAGAGNFDFVNSSGGGFYYRWIQNGATAMQLSTANNLLIGTVTDSGYKLDVAGSAYIGSNPNAVQLTVNGAISAVAGAFLQDALSFNGTNRIIYANGLSFTTNNSLSNLEATRYLFTQQTPSANSGTGVVDLVKILMPVNTGAGQNVTSRGLVIDFSVTTNGGSLVAIDAVQGTVRLRDLSGTGSRMVVADANGVLSTQAIPDLTGYVTLSTAQTITGEKIFTTGISAVGGIALRDTVGGSNYGGIIANSAFFQISAQGGSAILIKASDGTNALTIGTTGNTLMTNVTATSFIRSGGTSSQFLKADGSVDSNTYLTSASVSGVYLPLSGGTLTGGLILSPASGAASITMNAPTGQLNEIVFKVNNVNAGWMYVNASYFQFNSSTSGGYLFKNTAGTNILAMTDAGAATFNSSVTLSSSGGNLDVGGVAIIRGNGSAYSTHELTTGAANVALYDQRNAAGTVINRINAGGTSYFNGGNVGIGLTNPAAPLEILGANEGEYFRAGGGTISGRSLVFSSYSNSGFSGVGHRINVPNANGQFSLAVGGTDRFIIASGGAATFSSSVTAAGSMTITGASSSINPAYIMAQTGGNTYSAIGINRADGTGIAAGLASALVLRSGDSSDYPIQFATANNVRMTISSGGNVGINTTSPTEALQANGSIRVLQTNNTGIAQFVADASNTTSLRCGLATFGNSASDVLLGIGRASNSFLYKNGGTLVIGTEGAFPLIFSTGDSERMRITAGGYFKASNNGNYISSTDPTFEIRQSSNAWNTLVVSSSASDPYGLFTFFTGASPNNTSNYFLRGADSTANRFYVYSNGNMVNTNGSYGALSDVRLKENITDAASKLADLLKVKVRNYNLIGDDKKQIGVIAQELETVFPSMVEIDGESGMKQVKYSVFVPMLIKAIQEQQAQIEQLKSK